MSRHDLDWGYLTHGLAWRFAGCAVALLLLAGSMWLRADYGTRTDAQRQQVDALELQRVELASRLRARAEFEERFAEIEAAGMVGEEQRLQWAQTLRDSAGDLRLPYLRYTAMPRQVFEAPYLLAGVAAPVLATSMELQAGLVHEGDLLRLIERLRAQAPGLVGVTGCTLERVSSDALPQADKANITSTCQLRWYSIQLPSAAVAMESGQ